MVLQILRIAGTATNIVANIHAANVMNKVSLSATSPLRLPRRSPHTRRSRPRDSVSTLHRYQTDLVVSSSSCDLISLHVDNGFRLLHFFFVIESEPFFLFSVFLFFFQRWNKTGKRNQDETGPKNREKRNNLSRGGSCITPSFLYIDEYEIHYCGISYIDLLIGDGIQLERKRDPSLCKTRRRISLSRC